MLHLPTTTYSEARTYINVTARVLLSLSRGDLSGRAQLVVNVVIVVARTRNAMQNVHVNNIVVLDSERKREKERDRQRKERKRRRERRRVAFIHVHIPSAAAAAAV